MLKKNNLFDSTFLQQETKVFRGSSGRGSGSGYPVHADDLVVRENLRRLRVRAVLGRGRPLLLRPLPFLLFYELDAFHAQNRFSCWKKLKILVMFSVKAGRYRFFMPNYHKKKLLQIILFVSINCLNVFNSVSPERFFYKSCTLFLDWLLKIFKIVFKTYQESFFEKVVFFEVNPI